MAKPKIQIGDTVREMTTEEYAQWQTDNEELQTQIQAKETKAAIRQAVLDKLGLTVDEAAALFG